MMYKKELEKIIDAIDEIADEASQGEWRAGEYEYIDRLLDDLKQQITDLHNSLLPKKLSRKEKDNILQKKLQKK